MNSSQSPPSNGGYYDYGVGTAGYCAIAYCLNANNSGGVKAITTLTIEWTPGTRATNAMSLLQVNGFSSPSILTSASLSSQWTEADAPQAASSWNQPVTVSAQDPLLVLACFEFNGTWTPASGWTS